MQMNWNKVISVAKQTDEFHYCELRIWTWKLQLIVNKQIMLNIVGLFWYDPDRGVHSIFNKTFNIQIYWKMSKDSSIPHTYMLHAQTQNANTRVKIHLFISGDIMN